VDIHVVEIEKSHGLAVFRRKREYRKAHGAVAILIFQSAIRGAAISRLRSVAQRHCPHWYSPQFRTIQIRRQRKQPRGKGCVPAPGTESAISPQKSLLRHVFRPSAVPAEPVSEIDQRTLPAAHNALEGGNLTRKNLSHIGEIFVSRHYRSLRYDQVISAAVAFLFRKKVQPARPALCQTRCSGNAAQRRI
jgi:hypothetical protein